MVFLVVDAPTVQYLRVHGFQVSAGPREPPGFQVPCRPAVGGLFGVRPKRGQFRQGEALDGALGLSEHQKARCG